MIATALVAISIVAGCGGSSDSAAETSSAASSPDKVTPKAAFIPRANLICKEGSDEIKARAAAYVAKHKLNAKSPDRQAVQEELITIIVVPAVRKQAEGIAALGAPAGDEAKAAAIVAGLEKVVEAGEEDPASLMKVAGGPLAEVNKAVKAYGIEECKQP